MRAYIEEKQYARKKDNNKDWEFIRQQALHSCDGYEDNRCNQHIRESIHEDSIDWEAVRLASVEELAETIKYRGMHNILGGRIKGLLNTIYEEEGALDLEWLRNVSQENAKAYLLSIRGLGLKSVECIRLLTLHHAAFPVDINVGRICVRLGWVPIEPLPEELQLHLLELYPVQDAIQKFLWPRLCTLDPKTLHELHYQLITFGKVFCTKRKPNCNACPMRTECKHYASAYTRAKLVLPDGLKNQQQERPYPSAPIQTIPKPYTIAEEETFKKLISEYLQSCPEISEVDYAMTDSLRDDDQQCYIEEPSSPEETHEPHIDDLEDLPYFHRTLNEDLINFGEVSTSSWASSSSINGYICREHDNHFVSHISPRVYRVGSPKSSYMVSKILKGPMISPSGHMPTSGCSATSYKASAALDKPSSALIPLPQGSYTPAPKLKKIESLRTIHLVYELPDMHPLLEKLDPREKDDPSPYLLAIWNPGEEVSQPSDNNAEVTFPGTFLIPCRTANKGSFPLNGTYFQVNEVFADHETSERPLQVPHSFLHNLQRHIVYFGTSVSNIYRGMSLEEIALCFTKGHVCVRGFDRHKGFPKHLNLRLHCPKSKQQSQMRNNKSS